MKKSESDIDYSESDFLVSGDTTANLKFKLSDNNIK